ncbi:MULTISPECIES: hypothetical protein [Okeania]|uniref:Uncharacterized protein n=1 Tax=Okeania hirsuta TaxID=1458930 RepID=A0A3N6Q4K3_9CYAN|nr:MULTISPECIES: hypothetical protein [Okeania]NES89484.1 hypothetical protein [Okeania sp. SIO2B9]NET75237.1 hypothetical protein [Okeania sp. SIO1F9]RQH10160.1 hypothetical protein D4Z78_28240 [Okeania hirsuta]RQH24026.1 hypothetical protein D5R40_30270 [Okeania hirsuta]
MKKQEARSKKQEARGKNIGLWCIVMVDRVWGVWEEIKKYISLLREQDNQILLSLSFIVAFSSVFFQQNKLYQIR